MKESFAIVIVSFALIVGVAYAVYAREQARPGQEIVTAAEAHRSQVKSELADLQTRPLLGPIDVAWQHMQFLLTSCGVLVAPRDIQSNSTDVDQFYAGAVPAWHASVSGRALAVFSCLDAVNRLDSFWLGAIALDENGARVDISVLGRLPDHQWSSP